MFKQKVFLLAGIIASLLLGACSSDSVDGNGDYFRQGAFEVTVDDSRMVFIPTRESSNEVLFTWDRINQNYFVNDMSSTTNLVTLSLPSTIENLAGEGIRWHDLVRHNTYVETLQQMFINDDTTSDQSYASLASRVTADSYLYPIPLQQVEVCDGLYLQNPGY